jgi:hypothetical protein
MDPRNLGLGAEIGMGDISKYPHIFPPPGFEPIDRNGFFPTPGAGTYLLESISPIAPSYEGWVRLLALTSTDYSISYFTISNGGAPLKDYTLIQTMVGAPETPKPVFIRLKPNYTLEVRAVCTGVVGLRWSIFGWYYEVAR